MAISKREMISLKSMQTKSTSSYKCFLLAIYIWKGKDEKRLLVLSLHWTLNKYSGGWFSNNSYLCQLCWRSGDLGYRLLRKQGVSTHSIFYHKIIKEEKLFLYYLLQINRRAKQKGHICPKPSRATTPWGLRRAAGPLLSNQWGWMTLAPMSSLAFLSSTSVPSTQHPGKKKLWGEDSKKNEINILTSLKD